MSIAAGPVTARTRLLAVENVDSQWLEDDAMIVLHVFSATPVAAYAPGPPGFESIALTRADRDQLLVEMKRFIEAESNLGIPIEAIIREGNTASEILDQAADLKTDLLVMGTHGRSGFERFLLGSITEKVLRKANCPVLTVPRRHRVRSGPCGHLSSAHPTSPLTEERDDRLDR